MMEGHFAALSSLYDVVLVVIIKERQTDLTWMIHCIQASWGPWRQLRRSSGKRRNVYT